MLENIADLMAEVDKFKGTVVSSEKLCNNLDNVTKTIEETNEKMQTLEQEYNALIKKDENWRDTLSKTNEKLVSETENRLIEKLKDISSLVTILEQKYNALIQRDEKWKDTVIKSNGKLAKDAEDLSKELTTEVKNQNDKLLTQNRRGVKEVSDIIAELQKKIDLVEENIQKNIQTKFLILAVIGVVNIIMMLIILLR